MSSNKVRFNGRVNVPVKLFPEKASLPIEVIEFGKVRLQVSPHCLNAEDPIETIEFGRVSVPLIVNPD